MINIELRNARLNSGLTQVEVANLSKVSERAYQEYEAGRRVPGADIAIRIAQTLNSNAETLFCKKSYLLETLSHDASCVNGNHERCR